MTITITEKEYDAIAFALDQIGTEVEAATDEAFIADAEKHCNSLYNIMEKYKKARYKAREFESQNEGLLVTYSVKIEATVINDVEMMDEKGHVI